MKSIEQLTADYAEQMIEAAQRRAQARAKLYTEIDKALDDAAKAIEEFGGAK